MPHDITRPAGPAVGLYSIIGIFLHCVAALLVFAMTAGADGRLPGAGPMPAQSADSLAEAARLFFNGEYDASAEMTLRLREQTPDNLATFEQRSSALHFQLKRELVATGHATDRKRALRECTRCAALIEAIVADVTRGRDLAHARLKQAPADVETLFLLGKIDLTYVWLRNDTLGQRTGWSEYREARRVLDDALARDPDHIRARVARAFMFYVVDTRVPWAFRWMLGGGDKKRAIEMVRAATDVLPIEPGTRAEARFALWEMLNRDGQTAGAVEVARDLAQEFPENRELQRFLAEKGT